MVAVQRVRAVDVAVVVSTLVALIGLAPAAALAQPAQPSPSDPRKRYEELSEQAAQADEDLLKAQDDLKARKADLDRANADLAQARQSESQARAAEGQFRGQVDQLTATSYQGARFNTISAMLTSQSQKDFLDRAAALNILSAQQNQTLTDLTAVVTKSDDARRLSEDAQRRAQQATEAAQQLTNEVQAHKSELDKRIAEVKQALGRLSAADRADLGRIKDTGVYLGPPGAANDALQAALSKRGSAYVWAAAGPSTFDCSGLTMWAYKRAGINLPHSSRSQYTLGRPVSINELRPGDLVFYDDGTGNPARIHHVGMFVGDGKMVDAPTQGQVVDVRSIKGDGHYIGARRIVG